MTVCGNLVESSAMKIFLSYERFSYGRQKAGSTEERQSEAIAEAAREEGLPFDHSLSAKDKGLSALRGKHWKKGNLGKILDLIEAGMIAEGSVLCIEMVSRLSRERWRDQVKLWTRIVEKGVVIRICKPPMRISNENIDDLSVNCPLGLLMNLAHEESAQKARLISFARQKAIRRAKETGKPHGMRRPGWIRAVGRPHPEDETRLIVDSWELIEDRKDIIRKIHALCWEDCGTRSIIKRLQEEGIQHWKHGQRWTRGVIEYLLRTPALIGIVETPARNQREISGGGESYENYPPVLTAEEYEKTKQMLASRRGGGGRPATYFLNLWKGLVKAEDETPFTLCQAKKRGGGVYRYLKEYRNARSIPYQDFTDIVLQYLAYLTAADIDDSQQKCELTGQLEKLRSEISQKQLGIAALERQLSELSYERWPTSIVKTARQLQDDLEALQRELREVQARSSAGSRVEVLAEVKSVAEYLRSVKDPAEEEEVLKRLKRRLPLVIQEITVAFSGVKGYSKWIHVRVRYHGGYVQRYAWPHGSPLPSEERFCSDW